MKKRYEKRTEEERDGQAYQERGNEYEREGKMKAAARQPNRGRSAEVEESPRREKQWGSVIRLSDYISAVIWWLRSPLIPFEKTLQRNIWTVWSHSKRPDWLVNYVPLGRTNKSNKHPNTRAWRWKLRTRIDKKMCLCRKRAHMDNELRMSWKKKNTGLDLIYPDSSTLWFLSSQMSIAWSEFEAEWSEVKFVDTYCMN